MDGKFRLTAREKTLAEFAGRLSVYVRDIVVDRTGLSGKYDCSIVWATKDGPTIYAVVKQLGLRLEPEKLPVGVLVIDHVNNLPTEN